MSPKPVGTFRRLLPAALVLAMVSGLYVVARLPVASAATLAAVAERFSFTELPLALPAGLARHSVRTVNPQYEHIRAWISAFGAAIAVNDLDGDGVSNDLCVVDTRSDAVIVTAAPETGDRYRPFVLDLVPLPRHAAMAPMGCLPGDFNEDGRMDLLVYFWGRTPIIFMHRAAERTLALSSYRPIEVVPLAFGGGQYQGRLWNTTAVTAADFDGDGHVDLGVFNYFPDSQVLDPYGRANGRLNHSMSHATNAGGGYLLRWTAARTGNEPSVIFVLEPDAIDPAVSTGWTLAAASADLDGDLLPELYLANDFGNDRFFHNASTPGHIRFWLAEGNRGPFTPKSFALGRDSFKSRSVEFGDLSGNGRFDVFVSNTTTSWGLEESNFVWHNIATTPAAARTMLRQGIAPFENRASSMNLAWTGWGWDAKMADFDNSGALEVVQACGFVQGTINRWPWLQELAMSNDLLPGNPQTWPKVEPGDDIAGSQPFAFWVREVNGRYANISAQLGLTDTTPSRGIAVADANGDGAQDFAVARQWAAPSYYRNNHAGTSDYLGLRLYRPAVPDGGASVIGTPAYGAQVRIRTAHGRVQVAQVDGGGGHAGKRSFDVFFGLGDEAGWPVRVELIWRDLTGEVHVQALTMTAGWHNLMLTRQAQELAAA